MQASCSECKNVMLIAEAQKAHDACQVNHVSYEIYAGDEPILVAYQRRTDGNASHSEIDQT